ncbi:MULTISPECIES: BLUF domain-containing protein [Bacteria]|uniref:BLUF domain-containing protein n=1 Tax=Bacteria TaxID=2 RepID=UPI001EF51661|nr:MULTISPECIES: BLUF domain-containing protein [Bacteria]MCG7625262.1 BLUF domain-containing protein [Epibacterium sp. Ofav1-8]MEB3885773.1 BLUF domain-containing protein [Lyngbya sp. CCY1209]
MRRLMYLSHALTSMTEAKTAAIVEKSRRKNAACGLTGALVFSDGAFLQILEGPEAAVAARFAAIRTDARHHDITVISDTTAGLRCYPETPMALLLPDQLPEDARQALGSLYALRPQPQRRGLRDLLPRFTPQLAA